ncbi:MAG TPA: MAPEG family protein [Aeromonadales bacterium]|nr:MAPEG family protein [Aeromonadales bacterium]
MDIRFMILPGAILAIYTILVLFKLAILRRNAAHSGRIEVQYFKLYTGFDVPDDLRLWERHYNNLLELPIVYYFAIFVAISLQLTNMLNISLAWIYLVLRLFHSIIHLNGNKVKYRFQIFALSAFTLLTLWFSILYGLFSGWK